MAGFEGALPLDAFDVCAANPAREHVAEPEAALKLVEELSNGQALRKIKLNSFINNKLQYLAITMRNCRRTKQSRRLATISATGTFSKITRMQRAMRGRLLLD